MLILDDVHWADDASLELIAHLLRRPPAASLLIALAFRAGQVPNSLLAALEAAGRDGLVTDIRLGPLTQAEAGALLGTPAQEPLFRASGGNPFYLEELARAPEPSSKRFAAAGDEDAGRAPIDTIGVPPAVAAALGQEIRGLPDAARQLAWGASVAGDPFDLDLAAAAAGLGEREAPVAVEDLLAAGVAAPSDVAAPLSLPPSARAAGDLRRGGRGLAARSPRPRGRGARGHAARRVRGPRTPHRALGAARRRGGRRGARAGRPPGGGARARRGRPLVRRRAAAARARTREPIPPAASGCSCRSRARSPRPDGSSARSRRWWRRSRWSTCRTCACA